MPTSYEPQIAQVNEKPPSKSFLGLIFTQHPHDEDPKPREVHAHLEVKPLSNLVLLHFFELSHLGDFVANRPRF
jgi:hypothetical protein